jgi:hypothetical protein
MTYGTYIQKMTELSFEGLQGLPSLRFSKQKVSHPKDIWPSEGLKSQQIVSPYIVNHR